MPYHWLQPYVITILIGLSIVPLALWVGKSAAVVAGVLAILSFFASWRETRELEKLREHNRSLNEQLSRTRKLSSVDELSAGIAHEINNPLGIIAQEIEWIAHILKDLPASDAHEMTELKESLGVISEQVDRCKEIVQKLLSVAREMKPIIQRVDVNDLIGHIALILQEEASTKDITISKKFQPDLPQIYSDPPLLRQVILNLMVNATQAIERQGEITVSTESRDGNSIDIKIEDTGCGVPQELLEKIFTPFFTTKPPGQGTGMGLALCRGIIEKLGGSISVASNVGECTAFTIHLPIDKRQ